MKHPDDTSPFVVGYVVEYLVDFRGMTHWHFDRMRVVKCVRVQGSDVCVGHELCPYLVFREQMIDAKIFNK